MAWHAMRELSVPMTAKVLIEQVRSTFGQLLDVRKGSPNQCSRPSRSGARLNHQESRASDGKSPPTNLPSLDQSSHERMIRPTQ